MQMGRHRGLLAGLRQQGAAAMLFALVFVVAANVQAYARSFRAVDEEMCRTSFSQTSQQRAADPAGTAGHDGSCCDACVCAFPAAAPPPAPATSAAPRVARPLKGGVRTSRLLPGRKPGRARTRGPPKA